MDNRISSFLCLVALAVLLLYAGWHYGSVAEQDIARLRLEAALPVPTPEAPSKARLLTAPRVSLDEAPLVLDEELPEVSAPAALTGDPLELAPEVFVVTGDSWAIWAANFKLSHDRAADLWEDPQVREAFAAMLQRTALDCWLGEYQTRELARWYEHKASVPLDVELGLTLDWLLERSDDPAAMSGLIDDYSRAAAILVQRAGEDTSKSGADDSARWALSAGLGTVPMFQQAAQYLDKKLKP